MKINRRRSPRVISGLIVDITNHNGESVNAKTLDISCGGFGIQCSTIERNLITPQGDFVAAGRPAEFDVSIMLPDGEHGLGGMIVAKCRVVYSRRLANDRCEIGMRYIDIEGDGEERLVRYIQLLSQLGREN
jgi:c-di-GMP-binding flagellar brake protein YcgR